jgi:uncharacterized Zn-binding protein involved in type VI secretion
MANPLGARKDKRFKAVSIAPSINWTPVGKKKMPLPYPVTADLSNSIDTAKHTRFNGDPVYTLNQTTQPTCKGDERGSRKGIRSGTVNGEVKPTEGDTRFRVEGKQVVREGDFNTMNGGNTQGMYVNENAPSMGISDGAPDGDTNPPVELETPEEEKWGSDAASPEHSALGVVGAVLLVSAVSVIACAFGITIAPEDMYGFVILGPIFIPPAVAAAAKAAGAAAAGAAAKQAAKQVVKQAPKVAKKAKKKAKELGTKVKERLKKCAHLKPGKGKGGSHGNTKKRADGEKTESHHMPADSTTKLPKNDGPAVKVDKTDHRETKSWGRGNKAIKYRKEIGDLLKKGKWREALAKEIKDLRRVAGKKYNEGTKEMLEYAKCLGKHGLLK